MRRRSIIFVVLTLALCRVVTGADVTLDIAKKTEWSAKLESIRPGDRLFLDGKTYDVKAVLGDGSYGIVFHVVVNGRAEALKIVKGWNKVIPHDHTLPAQAEQMRSLRDGKIGVPEVYEAPEHGAYLRMALVPGERWMARIARIKDRSERMAEIEKVVNLMYELEKAGKHPGDLSRLGYNLVHDDVEGRYYLVDPGGVANGALTRFPQSLEGMVSEHELGAAALLRFEKLVRDGKRPEAAKALQGKGPPLGLDSRPNPYWVAEYIIAMDDILGGQKTHPSVNLLSRVSWGAIDADGLRPRVAAEARKLLETVQGSNVLDSKVRQKIHALVKLPGFDDFNLVEAYLERAYPTEAMAFLLMLPAPLRQRAAALPLVTVLSGELSDAVPLTEAQQRELHEPFSRATYLQLKAGVCPKVNGTAGESGGQQ